VTPEAPAPAPARGQKGRTKVYDFSGLGIDGKALLVDVKPEDKLALSVRNLEGVRVLPSNRVSARDVMNTRRVVLTQAALEKLQDALG
jgi:large subunit ribosomal protein L4